MQWLVLPLGRAILPVPFTRQKEERALILSIPRRVLVKFNYVIYSFIYLFIDLFIYLFIHLFIYLFSCMHLFIHLFVYV